MNFPRQIPLVYAGAFLLWGITGGEIFIAMLAAVALEAPRLLRRTVEVEERAYRMAWLLALMLMWILAINGWLELSRLEAVRSVLKWMPLALFPLAMASALAKQPGVPASALLVLLKQRYLRPTMGGVAPAIPRFDPFFPYLWAVLLAASYQEPGKWFYPASAVLLVAAVLMQPKLDSHRKRAVLWLASAAVAGVVCSVGIVKLYRAVENAIYGQMMGPSSQEINRTQTRIGSVDEIKVRKDVLWRVAYQNGMVPSYLYEATYDSLDSRQYIWNNFDRVLRRFDAIMPVELAQPTEKWDLGSKGDNIGRIRIRGMADYDFTILPLPAEAARLENLPAFRMDRNGLGVVRADSAQPVLDFEVHSSSIPPLRPLPNLTRDLALDENSLKIIEQTVNKLSLRGLPPDEAVKRVSQFFATDFTYTRDVRKASLRDFLESRRSGHCEYFATATVLLLRAAGIPARYNTGFALIEFDMPTKTWKVRGSHCHAWSTAWLDGHWEVVDTTPPDWINQDTGDMPFWQKFADWWGEKWMDFQAWRSSSSNNTVLSWLVPVAVILAVVYTVLRFMLGRRKRRRNPVAGAEPLEYLEWNGESHWRHLLPLIESSVGPRPSTLTTLAWVRALAAWPAHIRQCACLLVDDHNRRRFGPPARVPAREEPERMNRAAGELRKFLGGKSGIRD